MGKIEPPASIKEIPKALIKNMIALATSGFGVVVALAWNEAIKNAVVTYIDPYLGKSSGVVSLVIYASLMTVLAVLVTMQLTSIEKKIESLGRKKDALNEKSEKNPPSKKLPRNKK